MSNQRKPFVAGNWKMHGLRSDIAEFAAIASGYDRTLSQYVDVMVCPPFTLLAALAHHPERRNLQVGAQNCHEADFGAHTGDISARMIADCGAQAVIIGHSERRVNHHEKDALIACKAEAVWAAKMTAIICMGETEAERKSGQTLEVVERQIRGSVPKETNEINTIIAYEPVWAIGTGLTPSAKNVAEAHAHMRAVLSDHLGQCGNALRMLYGGSVKPENAAELMSIDNVDGALVGGASLKARSFLDIVSVYQ